MSTEIIASAPSNGGESVRLPGYDLLGELRREGLGVFYRARQRSLERIAVLYTVLGGTMSQEQYRYLQHEAAILASLRHPHVVRIYDRLEHTGRLFLVLEFVEGGSLDLRTGKQPQPCRPAAALVEHLARTVAHIHQSGIVHCDLKPHNVWLAAPPASPTGSDSAAGACEEVYGIPKISGLGLALDLARDPLPGKDTIRGTPAYMAPEQAQGRWPEVGPATDIHGLGAILYELLTGGPPFQGPSPLDTIRQAIEKEPGPPHVLRPEVDLALEAICQKCLHKAPSQRYASGRELAADLRFFLDGRPDRMSVRLAKRRWHW